MQALWPSENLLLGLLCERPMHGYELHQRIGGDPALSAIWRVERSEVYFLLRKLARQQLVEQVAVQQAGGPQRAIYSPTAAGREALQRWIRMPEPRPRDLRASFLAKLYLALRSDRGVAQALIAAQRRSLEEWLDRQRAEPAPAGFATAIYRLRLAQAEAALAALADLEEEMGQEQVA